MSLNKRPFFETLPTPLQTAAFRPSSCLKTYLTINVSKLCREYEFLRPLTRSAPAGALLFPAGRGGFRSEAQRVGARDGRGRGVPAADRGRVPKPRRRVGDCPPESEAVAAA